MKILFASSEVYPLIKTGGLADVSYFLPKAVQKLGQDLRIIMPAYRDAVTRCTNIKFLDRLSIDNRQVTLLETQLPNSTVKVWLVDQPEFFDRAGNPYCAADGSTWPDEVQRFAYFSLVVSTVAMGVESLNWRPDVVHCNDWHTGLVPVYLRHQQQAPAVLFTVHNLAYQGLCSYATFVELGLDPALWHFEALEFHQQLSLIKGGLVFADYVNTVSPSYAEEVKTTDFGEGLHGVFRARADSFCGILNGIDTQEWNPSSDTLIDTNYDKHSLEIKHKNKTALQRTLNLTPSNKTVLLGWVGRMVTQKGIDIVLSSLQALLQRNVQLVFLGSGDKHIEQQLRQCADKYPAKIALLLTYDEQLAHRIIAASDFFLMPSRFEPCGLTQMYCLRYGTIPIARAVGGLIDSIIDLDNQETNKHSATGILFSKKTSEGLIAAIDRALSIYDKQSVKKQLQTNGMSTDNDWANSAKQYLAIYQQIARY